MSNFLPFKRFPAIGLIHLRYAGTTRLAWALGFQKPVPPTKGGRTVYAASFSGFA